MLNELIIENFVTIEKLSVPFNIHLNVITGETGAGKSLILQAIDVACGGRADTNWIRNADLPAEVTAICAPLSPKIVSLLEEQGFQVEDNELLVRRIWTKQGRSRVFLNGKIATVGQLKDIMQHFIRLQHQHEYLKLLEPAMHLQLLDGFATLMPLRKNVFACYQDITALNAKRDALLNEKEQLKAEHSLLEYQLKELDELALQEGEYEQLQSNLILAKSGQQIEDRLSKVVYQLESSEHSAIKTLHDADKELSRISVTILELDEARDFLSQSNILIEEATNRITRFRDKNLNNVEAFEKISNRIEEIHTVARRQKIPPALLFEHYNTLSATKIESEHLLDELQTLEKELSEAHDKYIIAAKQLSTERMQHAPKFAKQLEQHLQSLNMSACKARVDVKQLPEERVHPTGLDDVRIYLRINPGLPEQALNQAVSGGELSRVALSVQLIFASSKELPTLIFDEIETGLSGETLVAVTECIKKLSGDTQILCITHAASLASAADAHLKLQKDIQATSTQSNIQVLNEDERLVELARLLNGDEVNDTAISHAKALRERFSSVEYQRILPLQKNNKKSQNK